MIVSLNDVLTMLGISDQYFIVNAANNILILKYNTGSNISVAIAVDGTYTGTNLATLMKTAIDTALTCSSTVVWSSTTKKFTISVTSGNTLTYSHSGSSAGLLVGFNQNHSAAISLTSDVETGYPTSSISSLHTSVEAWVKRYCRRDFELTNYKEVYDGSNTDTIFLKQYPIVNITRVAIGRRKIIDITNTSSTTTASVSVNDTGLVLVKDGVSDSTIIFATYATMNDICTAVNALGNGWQALLQGVDYGGFLSSELRPVYGLNCINNARANLYIPDFALSMFEVYPKEGYIQLQMEIPSVLNSFDYEYGIWPSGKWVQGKNNIFIDYSAGYSASNMPTELQWAICMIIKVLWGKIQEDSMGSKNYSLGDVSNTLEEGIFPKEALQILNSIKKVQV
jgi:hypothetical protein